MKSVFHPDAHFEHVDHWNGPADGFCDMACTLLRTLGPQQHLIGQHIVEVVSPTLAFGQAYGFALHRAVTPAARQIDNLLGARLLDRYEKRDGVWKIAHRKTVVDWNLDIDTCETWGQGAFGPPHMPEQFRGRKDRDDPSYTWREGAPLVGRRPE